MMISTTIIKEEKFAIITIKREPVNSMNLELWQHLWKALEECEGMMPAIRGIIITSGIESKPIFTAGNDINELYAPKTSKCRYSEFWKTSNQFLAKLYTSPLITICAIDGYCPAGGTCLAMCCDVRVATENVVMGLNEVQLGISVPYIWTKLMASLIGHGKMEKIVQFATMVPSKEGIKIGLVDHIVESKQQLLPAAAAVIKKLLKLPDSGRIITKKSTRQLLANEWSDDARLTEEAGLAWSFLSKPEIVQVLAKFFQKSSSKL